MATEYTLLIKKEYTSTVSSLDDYGFAISEISWPNEEIQELAARVWPGEDGEDVYIPPRGLAMKAFDLVVEFLYKGARDTLLEAYTSFKEFMTGRDGLGAELEIYDCYWKRGYTGVYVKQFGDIKVHKTNIDEAMSMKAVLRITNPLNRARLNYVGDKG